MNNNIYWGGADHWYCGYCGKGPGHADDCTRPQPTASVDAEQVWNAANNAAMKAPYGTPDDQASVQAAIAVIQAYGDSRADAARREALEEAAKVARDYASKAAQRGWVLKPGSIVTAARHIATTIRALKGNPNAG